MVVATSLYADETEHRVRRAVTDNLPELLNLQQGQADDRQSTSHVVDPLRHLQLGSTITSVVRLREVKEKSADEPNGVVDPPDCQHWLLPVRPAKTLQTDPHGPTPGVVC